VTKDGNNKRTRKSKELKKAFADYIGAVSSTFQHST
jgi:hypothetical protein